ncbi:hypothetical protein [Nonomuraea soli]|uniref:Uncharacterized protein n=1 Tax=Nonomuraea soli TaxID=1032476 RepID=A0A7W0HQS4_9ACTN|nr:hypothetical protein [Nonomuraea soli]MBA2892117.1 hypothetical protein [Nonomuraea soli]
MHPARACLAALCSALAGLLILAGLPAVAQAASWPIFPPTCSYTNIRKVEDRRIHIPKAATHVIPALDTQVTFAVSSTWTETATATLSTTFGIESSINIGKIIGELQARGEATATASYSITGTGTYTTTLTVPPHHTMLATFGVYYQRQLYKVDWQPGCEPPLYTFFGGITAMVPLGTGYELKYDRPGGQGRPNPGGGSSVNPPRPPTPQPVTSVVGLADGTLLATTDTRRIYKMVGGAPVWQSTCGDGICNTESRPTTQAVINAGPATPRNGSSAIDQRGRIYIFVGGAPLHQAHCSAPVNCGTPPKISNWSIDARDHMNGIPADGQLIQGWDGGSATPVAMTVGGARINFANPQEITDTGHGSNWASKVTILSSWAFKGLGEVPIDGTLVQGTGGGASTPVAVFVAGARINFASPQEVVDAGYGADWASRVRAIPTRAFNLVRPDLPADGTLVQGQGTPVAAIVGGARINFASPQEVVDSGFGADWAGKVRSVPTRAFNLIPANVPADGTLVQGQGTPVAAIIGGARVNFASPQEIIDSGFGTNWASMVRAIPTRAFNLIGTQIADGTRIQNAGSTSQAAIVGGAKIPFVSMAELVESGYGNAPTHIVPTRVWTALSDQIMDGTRIQNAGSTSQAAIVGGAKIPFVSMAELTASGYAQLRTQMVPNRVWVALSTRIADGTRIKDAASSGQAAIIGGAKVTFNDITEVNDSGYGDKPIQIVPNRVWVALSTRIADGTRIKDAGSTGQAAIVGGAKIPFVSMAELVESGYGDAPLQVVPNRVWAGLPAQIGDGTIVKAPTSAERWLITSGQRSLTTGSGTTWTIPARVLSLIPQAH